MNRALISVFITVFLFCGCDKLPFLKKPAKEQPAQTVKTAQEPKEEVKINGALLARVNDWAIGADDFKSYIDTLKPMAQAQGIDVDTPEFKAKLLKDLVRNQILSQIASERGLDKNADVVKALRETRTTLLASKIAAEVDKNTNVSFAEVQAFYDQNKEKLRKPEERKIREIVVNSQADANDANIKILQGQDFAEVAKAVSVGETKNDGGSLGFVVPDPEKRPVKFWQVAFLQLEKGGVSPSFKLDNGKYYIIKVEDIKPGEIVPLNSELPLGDGTKVKVEEQLKISLKSDKTEKEINRLVDDYKTRSKVEIKEDLLK